MCHPSISAAIPLDPVVRSGQAQRKDDLRFRKTLPHNLVLPFPEQPNLLRKLTWDMDQETGSRTISRGDGILRLEPYFRPMLDSDRFHTEGFSRALANTGLFTERLHLELSSGTFARWAH